MEWYWVLAIVLAFFGIVGGLIWLGKSNKLTAPDVGFIAKVVDALSTLAGMLSAATESKALDVMAMVMQVVDKAVKAAENDFYNKRIAAEERYGNCMKYFDQMLAATGLTLTDVQRKVIDTLIKAACEEMGHTLKAATMVGDIDLGVTEGKLASAQ